MPTPRPMSFTRHGRRIVIVAILDLAIVLGVGAHLAGGIVTGASADSDPVRLLGTNLIDGSCPSAPLAIGRGNTIVCSTWTAIVSPAGLIEVVSLYGPGSSAMEAFGGTLPLGLHWGDEVSAVWTKLGQPNRVTDIYGTPTLVYMFTAAPYGSLELRFDASDHLVRVNASLVR